jgi:hypothetical protein
MVVGVWSEGSIDADVVLGEERSLNNEGFSRCSSRNNSSLNNRQLCRWRAGLSGLGGMQRVGDMGFCSRYGFLVFVRDTAFFVFLNDDRWVCIYSLARLGLFQLRIAGRKWYSKNGRVQFGDPPTNLNADVRVTDTSTNVPTLAQWIPP